MREKLRSIVMSKTDIVTSYLTRISHICDDLVAVGETISNVDLVRTTLDGFSRSGLPLLRGLCPRRIFLTGRGYGMTLSRRRLVKRLYVAGS